jgi:two-component system, chemotaxis family, protein-glutamate methylesterase/glutaminase
MGSALAKNQGLSPPSVGRQGHISVMVVDDSLTARSALVRTIEARPDMEVVATAGSAEVALELLDGRQVHVILLDLEMPGMGGLKALPQILAKARGAQVCVVSTLATAGAKATLAALAMGAADTLAKPRSGAFTDAYREELVSKIVAIARVDRTPQQQWKPSPSAISGRAPAIVAIGASTGGIHALGRLLDKLSPSIELPILVTQHLPSSFMSIFARQLASMSGRKTRVAADGMTVEPGQILVAPGDGHLTLRREDNRVVAEIADYEVPNGCRPSVDPMLESVASLYGARGMGIILSGMGRDGSLGARSLFDAGGALLAQDEDSCAVFGMPRGIVEAGLAAAVGAPEELAAFIGESVQAK